MAIHDDVMCDECGMYPIVGVRYVATHLYEYDICEACFKDAHATTDGDSFARFDRPTREARKVCRVADNRILATSIRGAAAKIRQNVGSLYAKIELSALSDLDKSEDLKTALMANANLEIIHIHICNFPYVDNKLIMDIAKGLARNSSIRRVFWHIAKRNRNMEIADAIRDIIQNSKCIETLSIERTCRGEGLSTTTTTEDAKDDNKFAATVFDALKDNKALKILRLGSYHVLSEETKKRLLDSVKKNTCIRKVYADFEKSDQRLELLLACNRERWMERLGREGATNRQRLNVLTEALSYEKAEPVSTAYHLLRRFPDLLLRK